MFEFLRITGFISVSHTVYHGDWYFECQWQGSWDCVSDYFTDVLTAICDSVVI